MLVEVIQDGVMTAAAQYILRPVARDLFRGPVPKDDPAPGVNNVDTIEDAVQHGGEDAVASFELRENGVPI